MITSALVLLVDQYLSAAQTVAIHGVAAVLSGVLWQLAYRRDLADRLLFWSGLFVVSLLFGVIPGAEVARDLEAATGMSWWVGVVAGLVLGEQRLRLREGPRVGQVRHAQRTP